MTQYNPTSTLTSIIFIYGSLLGLFQKGTSLIPNKLRTDNESIQLASTDYGLIVHENPKAVLYPTSIYDITKLIKYVYDNPIPPFGIAARGQGHSVRGQPLAKNGIVINMTYLSNFRNGGGVVVSSNGSYVDVGGEQLWIDVLNETLKFGRTPISWTNYLYLTVGGTLSNAGMSGHTFRVGPQISNVMELDVITGKGKLRTCSPTENSDLFFAVLGGLGQFGIITRARIALDRAPTGVKWVRALYSNFSVFIADQERLVLQNGNTKKNTLDFVQGLLLLSITTQDNTSFYPVADQPRILSLIQQHDVIYTLEVAKYYYDSPPNSHEDKEFVSLLESELSFESGFLFEKDLTYLEFLNRFHEDELRLRKLGLWDVPHPWLSLFVPKSGIGAFDVGIYRDIILKRNLINGVFFLIPELRNKWDDRTSAAIPDENNFYFVGFQYLSGLDNLQLYDNANQDILDFCATAGIQTKQYLPYYKTQEDWSKHFGSKWRTFQQRKHLFDPKHILSPGQKIFN